MNLLHMSFAGGMMVAVILLIRWVLQHRLHRSVLLTLWLAVVIRLMIPLRIQFRFSVFNLLRDLEPELSVPADTDAAVQATQAAAAAAPFWTSRRILLLIWAAGFVGVLGYFLIVHLRNRWQYQFSLPYEGETDPLPARVRLRTLDSLSAPLTYGVWKPVILVPRDFRELDRDKQRQMLQHELAHIHHKDVVYKAVMLLTLAVHWFNPMVWIMAFTASQDLEMRADAEAVRQLGKKAPYARTLVEVETSRMNSALSAGFSFNSTRPRIYALQKGKVHPLRSAIALLIFLTLTLGLFATEASALVLQIPDAPTTVYMPPIPAADAAASPSVSESQTRTARPSKARLAEDLGLPVQAAAQNETEIDEPAETAQPSEAPRPTQAAQPTEPTQTHETTQAPETVETQPAPAETDTEPPVLPEAEAQITEPWYEPLETEEPPEYPSISSPGTITISAGQEMRYNLFCDRPLNAQVYQTDGEGLDYRCKVRHEGDYNTLVFSAPDPGTFEIQISYYYQPSTYWATIVVTP